MQKKSRLVKIAHDDPDRAMQRKVYDALVANGLSEEMAATVVSNIPIMDMRDLWKKLKPKQEEPKEHEDPYGWRHSCGESFYQFDSPGDPCPSCGESGGDWEWYDEDMVKESNIKKITSNRSYRITKKAVRRTDQGWRDQSWRPSVPERIKSELLRAGAITLEGIREWLSMKATEEEKASLGDLLMEGGTVDASDETGSEKPWQPSHTAPDGTPWKDMSEEEYQLWERSMRFGSKKNKMKKIAANKNYRMIKRGSQALDSVKEIRSMIQGNIQTGLTEYGAPEISKGDGLEYNFKLNLIPPDDPHREFVQKAISAGDNNIPEYSDPITPDEFHLEPFLSYKQTVAGSENSELTEFVKEKFDEEKEKNIDVFKLLSKNAWVFDIPIKVIPTQYDSSEIDFDIDI